MMWPRIMSLNKNIMGIARHRIVFEEKVSMEILYTAIKLDERVDVESVI